MLLLSPAAGADSYTSTDRQYLAQLNHGGICCPQQADTPIPYSSPDSAIALGKALATDMTANPTYAGFKNLSRNIVNDLGASRLNGFQAGEVVVIAVHYYASPTVECALMKDMGGAMGEAPYWYGPVTYSGGLAVQPGCIKFSS
ncbi:DUF732 domain-containing protein [Mycobacterium paraintracellulare]|uniref:DUF732 domain-containing protein n=1 Tax=Mycobacterium avium complex (MAC) TaxID=120793 RepID=UPI0009FF6FF8|nr:hypothetical protein MINTM003_16550 [Mycobacterium paraintracellulare]BCO88400.1 hypothetical protein MINTM015_16570 [Mycobacterium paraintracellulare]